MLNDSQKARLQKAEDLLAEAAGLVEDVSQELDQKADESDYTAYDLDAVYEDAYGGMVKLSNIRTQTV